MAKTIALGLCLKVGAEPALMKLGAIPALFTLPVSGDVKLVYGKPQRFQQSRAIHGIAVHVVTEHQKRFPVRFSLAHINPSISCV